MSTISTIGRRKTSVARINFTSGKGKITVNNRELSEYFPSEVLQIVVKQPLVKLEQQGSYDINVNVFGGGLKGQAEATRLAISRALVQSDEENKPSLKIVISSGLSKDDCDPDIAQKAFHFVKKPYIMEDLFDLINSV